MSKQWFVLNTLTGQEQKVQKLLVAKAAESEIDMAGMIGETLMPTVKEVSTRNGRKTTVTRKLFPGYVFAELDLYTDFRRRDLLRAGRARQDRGRRVHGQRGHGAVRRPGPRAPRRLRLHLRRRHAGRAGVLAGRAPREEGQAGRGLAPVRISVSGLGGAPCAVVACDGVPSLRPVRAVPQVRRPGDARDHAADVRLRLRCSKMPENIGFRPCVIFV